MFDQVRGRAVDLGSGAGWGLVKAMPGAMSERAFRAGADAAAVRNGSGAQQLRKNLRRVVGPQASEMRLDALVGDGLRSYARYWLETFRLPKMNHDQTARQVEALTDGVENVDAAMQRGRGVVFALPHSGNWDVAALWLIHHGVPFTTVVERLKPESLFDRFVAYRESLGMEVLPLTGGERQPADVLRDRLRAGGAICLMADRDLSTKGIAVQFFGEATRMPAGPALLAATTGASLIPVSLWFTKRGWGQRIGTPIQLPEGRLRERVEVGTQALADAFALEIAKHPADWHMVQPLWLADLAPRPARAAALAGD